MINDRSGRREWLAPTPPSLPRPRRRRHLLHPCNLPQPECRSFLAVLLPSPISFQGVAGLVASPRPPRKGGRRRAPGAAPVSLLRQCSSHQREGADRGGRWPPCGSLVLKARRPWGGLTLVAPRRQEGPWVASWRMPGALSMTGSSPVRQTGS
jgi:hypothetical protein